MNFSTLFKISQSLLPSRLFILDIMEQRVKKTPGDAPLALTRQLAAQFCQQSDCILRTVADRVDALEPVEVATLLRILACLSPHPPHLQALQGDRSFFINCACQWNSLGILLLVGKVRIIM